MAIRYVCDFCGADALTRQLSETQFAMGSVGLPRIDYKDVQIEVVICKKETDAIAITQHEKHFGDICLDCLIEAVRSGMTNR